MIYLFCFLGQIHTEPVIVPARCQRLAEVGSQWSEPHPLHTLPGHDELVQGEEPATAADNHVTASCDSASQSNVFTLTFLIRCEMSWDWSIIQGI